MFTDEHFVPYTGPNDKLGRKHRALIQKYNTRTRHRKYLQIGKPGRIHLSWRIGHAPGCAPLPSPDSTQTQSLEADEVPAPWAEPHDRPTPLPKNGMLSGNAHDPFRSLPIAKQGSLDPLRTLSSLFRGWAPIIEYESGPRPGEIQHPFLNKLLPMAMQNADLLGAILTDAQYWNDVFLMPKSPRPLCFVFQYRGQAITHIRKQLLATQSKNNHIGDATILAICFLMIVDSYYDDTVSQAAHAKAMKKAVSSRGGLRCLDPFLKYLILAANFWLQYEGPVAPLFPREEYANEVQCLDRLAVATSLQICLALPFLPITFAQLLQRYPMSVQLFDILMRTQEWTAILQRLWSRQAKKIDYESFAQTKAFSVLDDILYLRSRMRKELTETGQENEQELCPEMLVVLTLTLYICNTTYRKIAPTWSIYQELLIEATELIKAWLRPRNQVLKLDFPLRNTIIWCSMVVVDSWRQSNNDIDPKGMALLHCVLDVYPELREWDVLSGILLKSLWYGGFLKGWEFCWRAGRKSCHGLSRSLGILRIEEEPSLEVFCSASASYHSAQ